MELISRDEAKRKITEELDSIDHVPSWVFKRLERIIGSLPTIEERNEGKWIHESCSRLIDETDEGRVYAIEKRWNCSLCGFSKGFRMYRPDEKYCPNCGAKMKGE